ncbi:MAG TPA: proline racemase family protein, partial [Microbacteriaceae bacterium]|nr:proline racemase family protein [Microbacteriaceae bacterium]
MTVRLGSRLGVAAVVAARVGARELRRNTGENRATPRGDVEIECGIKRMPGVNGMRNERSDDLARVSGWTVRTVDYHTAGEPFRIVPDLPFTIAGDSVIERRSNAQAPGSDGDLLRRLLVNEPRGHADMYGGFIVPPNDDGAHFGVLFWHKDGFSTACGHGTMALGCWAVRSGLVPPDP